MAVYTILSASDLENILSSYSLGKLQSFEPISSGIENTNYFLKTKREELETDWVLTIFENLEVEALPFFCELTTHLSRAGLSVPAPVRDQVNEFFFSFEGKAGLIVPRLWGDSVVVPSADDCFQVGVYLAEMHLAVRDFPRRRSLERDYDWMEARRDALEGFVPEADYQLLVDSLARYQAYQFELLECPQGVVHGDLFRDNVLFHEGQVSGVIDFYHACDATLLFDLAVAANDWAVSSDVCAAGIVHNTENLRGIITGYQSRRPWTALEERVWPRCLEVAALRFWISRLVSLYLPSYQHGAVSGEVIKDPNEMKRILLSVRDL
jgi:homoserine kinase type II